MAENMHSSQEDSIQREKFSNKVEYFLTSLSYAVGLGNVWRFPYLCYKYGGGSFFIPYLICLVVIGFPFFFLESCLGQYTSEGPMTAWKIAPAFKGIGIAMFVMSSYVAIYYNVVVAWAIYFLYSTFTKLPNLPWSTCDNEWNTNNCYLSTNGSHSKDNSSTSPSAEFFNNHVLNKSKGIDDLGGLNSHLVICLAIAWFIIFLFISRGVKGLGKVAYFTAIFPYIMITVLVVRGASLDGATQGIIYYLKPDWSKLLVLGVWAEAASQIFFSLSICTGGVLTLSSYNPFKNNCLKDTILITVCNSLTSIYSGFAIFSVIGFMSKNLNQAIDKVSTDGPGLVFDAYPAALSLLPVAPLWSCLFFLMILSLGFGSEMTLIETIVMTIVDQWPDRLRQRKTWVLLSVCIVMFLAGLSMCTNGGLYVLALMDSYCLPYPALIIAVIEVIAISWVYGINRFMDNIKEMIGFYPKPVLYWKSLYKFVCPVLIATLLGFKFSNMEESGNPKWTVTLGWLFCTSSVIFIPILAIFKWFESRKTQTSDTFQMDSNNINRSSDNI